VAGLRRGFRWTGGSLGAPALLARGRVALGQGTHYRTGADVGGQHQSHGHQRDQQCRRAGAPQPVGDARAEPAADGSSGFRCRQSRQSEKRKHRDHAAGCRYLTRAPLVTQTEPAARHGQTNHHEPCASTERREQRAVHRSGDRAAAGQCENRGNHQRKTDGADAAQLALQVNAEQRRSRAVDAPRPCDSASCGCNSTPTGGFPACRGTPGHEWIPCQTF